MIVRKYEDSLSGTYVEFWINDGKAYCMVNDGTGNSLTTELDHRDLEDLRNWLYDASKEIAPIKQPSNG